MIHHSDAGSQYVSVAFTAELIAAGIAGSIGTVGDALDNALCESTIGLFKTKAINPAGPAWTDRRDVEWQVARLMRLAGISGAVRGKHRTMTTEADRTAPWHPDLVRRGWRVPTGTDQLWVADFSYVLDVGRVLLRRVRRRRLLTPDPGLAGHHHQAHRDGHRRAAAGAAGPPPRRARVGPPG